MIALSIISLCVSFLALVFSVFVYVKHDKKLKEYQVYKIEEELRAKRSAVLRVEKVIEPNIRGFNDVFFVLRNDGRAKAIDVLLHCEPNIMVGGDFRIECLNPGQEERRMVALGLGDGDKFELTYEWTDEEGRHKDSSWTCFG